MNEFLLRHAIANVWCNPSQDRQYTYKLAQLSPRYGVQGNINLFYERVALPTTDERYHVYQIGRVLPKRVGLPQRLRQWISLKELAEDELLLTDLYMESGIQFPRFESYVWLTPNRNLVVAVKINDRIHKLRDQALYLRFYSNAYYNSERSTGRRYIHCNGMRVNTEQELLNFQYELINLLGTLTDPFPYYYVNGRFVQNISLTTAGIGDVVEFVIDGSIKRMVEFPIASLESFTSTLDSLNKYILHYDDPTVQTIEFLDDVDVFLIRPTLPNRYMGVTYHRNTRPWMRMLTHKDYSVPVNRINDFIAVHPDDPRRLEDPVRWPSDAWTTQAELTLRLYIRHSGYDRPLVAEANRIRELYRLPSEKIINAMTGTDSTLDLWRAENLEQCPYVQFMSADPSFVYPIAFNRPDANSLGKESAQQFAGDVYGYHAAATILAGTPRPTYSRDGLLVADLAYEHWYNATVYEFDSDGLFLGKYHHTEGSVYYVTRNANCALIEAITGKGACYSPLRFGNEPVEIPYGHNFRVYIDQKWGGVPRGEWVDITESADLATHGFLDDTVTPHRWVWTHNATNWQGAVSIDDQFVSDDLTLTKANGVLRFNLVSTEIHDGVPEEYKVMEIPTAQVDIFLNGHPMIEGLDYTLQWPEVVIHNLEHLVEIDQQAVHFRAYGFCDSSFNRLPVTEFGFVEHGILSHDQQYDITTHKVMRVVIDGRYYAIDELVFDEQLNELTIEGVRNGAPYAIQTPPVVFRDVYGLDSEARVEDDQRDQAVSDYMTVMFPTPPREPVDFIPTQYHVVSVFANKVLSDIMLGYLAPEGMTGHYSDMQLREWLAGYEWLLEYDLCDKNYDQAHVQIWPHWHSGPVSLNLYQYQLFSRALTVYLQNPPDISVFVNIVSLEEQP